jgi:hypothetical protein
MTALHAYDSFKKSVQNGRNKNRLPFTDSMEDGRDFRNAYFLKRGELENLWFAVRSAFVYFYG